MRRRTLLKSAGGVGAILAVSGRGTAQRVELQVSETNDPVQAGDFLEVTVDVTNTSGSEQRPALEFFVGDEHLLTKRVTIPAGETESVEFSHLTYPVGQDVAFPVRVQSDAESVERTVEVRGVDDLGSDRASPAGELTVPPDAAVLFEVESDTLGEYGGRTTWYLDDDFAGRSQGPWNAAYYQARGRDHWTQTFTAEGTYGAAASIRGDDANYAARWTIEVSADADGAPTVDSASPDPGPLDVASGETVDLEATVSGPAGLDRAVWWLGHADVILGTADLSGTEATVSLSTDAVCHGCPIILWVIDERGTVTDETLWTPRVTDDGGSQLAIADTNAPVEAGGDLEVTVDVTNTAGERRTEDLELVVGDEVVDTRSVTIDPERTATATLGYETYPVETDVSFPVVVRGETDRDATTVDVFAEVGPADVEIRDANDPVLAGDRLAVEAEVTNTHDATITDEIGLVAGDPVDSTTVTLAPDESQVITLGYDTYPVATDVEFPVDVVGTGCRDSRHVQVFAEEIPSVRVTVTGATDPVAAGEFLEVSAQVTNAGDSEITQDVSLAVGGEQVDSESVTIPGDQSTQVVLGYDTYPVRKPVEFPVTVEADGVSDQRIVSVSPNEGTDGDGDQQPGPGALELVDYYILGDDPQEEYITLRNVTDEPIGMSGWRIEDDGRVGENLNPYAFPSGFVLDPGATVTLVSGDGTDTDETLYWGVGFHIWSEDGDVVTVLDASGNAILEAPIAADGNGEEQDGDGDDATDGDDDSGGGDAGPVTVAIDGTNAPVEGGDPLTVQTTLTNEGAAEAAPTVELVAGGEVVDGRSVTVPGGESRSVELGYSTYPVQQDVSFDVTVRTDDDSAARTVQVFGTDGDASDGDSADGESDTEGAGGGESEGEDSGSIADEESGEGEATQSEGDEPAAEGDDAPESTDGGDQQGDESTGEEPAEEDEPAEDDTSDEAPAEDDSAAGDSGSDNDSAG